MKNRICEVFGIKYPIIQGPMAWSSNAPLVGAVSETGGLGVLGVGFAPPEIIIDQIRKTKALTDKPFAANVFIEPGPLEIISKIVVEEKVPVVYADTIVGLDYEMSLKHISYWHDHGIKVIVKAAVLADAITAEKAGADAVIAKGWEGGGHVTYESTMAFVPAARDVLLCPLLAGGGIADGRGIVAAFALGADGVEMGSAFLMSEECDVHPNVKKAIMEAGSSSTVVTGMPTDEPCRQIKNPLSDKLLDIEYTHSKEEAARIIREVSASSLKNAMADGDMIDGAVMVGQIVPLLNSVRPAREIIETAMEEARELLCELKVRGCI